MKQRDKILEEHKRLYLYVYEYKNEIDILSKV